MEIAVDIDETVLETHSGSLQNGGKRLDRVALGGVMSCIFLAETLLRFERD